MTFDTQAKRIVLDSVFPGVSVDTVVENTGFDLGIGKKAIPTVEPVSEEESRILREVVAKELSPMYPLFVQKLWG
jgi:glutaconate CoA-transferase subunit B